MTSVVLTDLRDGVLTVTINRPHSLNALTSDTFRALAAAFDEARSNARVMILTGGDQAFSSGADLQSSLQTADGFDLPQANAIIRTLIDLPVPTIAAVAGPAAGIGCSLALACDYVVMAEDAYLMLAFSKIGLMPDGGATALVAASAGRHRALHMALTAQKVDGRQAFDWGLCSEAVDSGTQLTRARELAHTFALGAPLAIARTKHAINSAALDTLPAGFEREVEGQSALRRTRDFEEGVAAFIDKRTPMFTGR